MAVQRPVSEIPIDGFDQYSEFVKNQTFKDETVQEREKFELENGYEPDYCKQEFPEGRRGYCTRPKGHIERGESGMHIAGCEDFVVGAW